MYLWLLFNNKLEKLILGYLIKNYAPHNKRHNPTWYVLQCVGPCGLSSVCSQLWSLVEFLLPVKVKAIPMEIIAPCLIFYSRVTRIGCIVIHVCFVYTGWLLCIGLRAIAISHWTSTQTRGNNMFHTSSEAQYKTTLKVASFSEQDPEGVLPV